MLLRPMHASEIPLISAWGLIQYYTAHRAHWSLLYMFCLTLLACMGSGGWLHHPVLLGINHSVPLSLISCKTNLEFLVLVLWLVLWKATPLSTKAIVWKSNKNSAPSCSPGHCQESKCPCVFRELTVETFIKWHHQSPWMKAQSEVSVQLPSPLKCL